MGGVTGIKVSTQMVAILNGGDEEQWENNLLGCMLLRCKICYIYFHLHNEALSINAGYEEDDEYQLDAFAIATSGLLDTFCKQHG